MAPSNPKRPPRPPRPPGAVASKKEEVELPFDDDEVAPLQEDDPRPQRVPQYPAGPRRSARGAHGGPRDGTKDRELAAKFDTNEYSDPGHMPAFLYVEKGPGAGQLLPVKQGPLVIGRASSCELRLQHPSISRRHAQLMRQGDRFVLRDLNSQNGTFVNRFKVNSDHEVLVGDEITLGNAVLKLRGSSVSSDQVPQVAEPVRAPARRGLSRRGLVAVLGVVGGLAVAVLLLVAFLKFSEPARPAAPPPAESAPPAGAAAAKSEADYVPPPPASEEAAPKAAPEEEDDGRALKPLQPREETAAPPSHKASGPKASELGSKGSTSRKGAKSAKGSPRKPEARAAEKTPALKVDKENVLARYEQGDVEEALSQARAGQLEPLATKIAQFQSSRAAGEQALKAQDTAGAIQHLSSAVMVDQELSQGWSGQGRALRKQLGTLYMQLGEQQTKAGAQDQARESFQLAVKYDPTNTAAKLGLQQLGGKK
jgi:hypothetical protein